MSIRRRTFLSMLSAGVIAGVSGCTGSGQQGADGPGVVGESLVVSTTTSTHDTGLLGALNAAFEDRYGAGVHAVAQGTGAALETARNGDSDVVLVHARSLEDEFLRDGYGVNRRTVMMNDFVILGPRADPAGVGGYESPIAAFEAIAAAEAPFVSRGDNSGTHQKERTIWEKASARPAGEWYREAGQGMGEVLNIAHEQGSYTLADRGTYLARRANLDIVILVEGPIKGGHPLLANPYGIMAVNPAIHDAVNYDLAMAYIGYLTSPSGQEIIEEYEVDGEQLFYPTAISTDPEFQQYVPEGWQGDPADQ